MTSDVKEEKIGKEESASATDLIHAVVKTSNGLKMYMPNNPLLQRFLVELKEKMTGHLGRYGEFKLDIDHFEMRYKGKSVYENRDPKESIAFRVYSDGIRSLVFSEGIEDREIADFLEIVGKEYQSGMDDDMVTLLWTRDLPHITYILAEEHVEFDAAGAGSAAAASHQESIKELYNTMPKALTAAPLVIPQNILKFSERESEWLKNAKEADEKRNPFDAVINILSSILSVENNIAVFGRFVDITVNMIGNLIHSGEIDYAVRLIRFLRELQGSESLSSDHLDRVKKTMEKEISSDIINDLERIIETTDKIAPKGLSEFLLFFGKSAIKQVFELLDVVKKREMKKVILDTLVEIGRDTPEAFFPFLSDSRGEMVRIAVYILRTIGTPSAMEPVSKLVHHREPGVRKEVLLYLAGINEAKAKSCMIEFLRDKESALRINALNALAGSGFREALNPIMEIAVSKDFEKRNMSEKKAVFEALGGLGSDQVVPMFRNMLMKRYWFKKEREKEQTFLAVSGLRRVRTDAAIKTLEEAGARKKGKIREIITQALKSASMEGVGR